MKKFLQAQLDIMLAKQMKLKERLVINSLLLVLIVIGVIYSIIFNSIVIVIILSVYFGIKSSTLIRIILKNISMKHMIKELKEALANVEDIERMMKGNNK